MHNELLFAYYNHHSDRRGKFWNVSRRTVLMKTRQRSTTIQDEFNQRGCDWSDKFEIVLYLGLFWYINGVWRLFGLFRNMKRLWNIAPQFWGLNHGMPVRWNCESTSKGSCGKVFQSRFVWCLVPHPVSLYRLCLIFYLFELSNFIIN